MQNDRDAREGEERQHTDDEVVIVGLNCEAATIEGVANQGADEAKLVDFQSQCGQSTIAECVILIDNPLAHLFLIIWIICFQI